MSPFDGKWKKVYADNSDAFILATFGPESNPAKDQLKWMLENLDNEEHFQICGNTAHRKCYVDGKLYAEITSTFDTVMPRTNIFGKLNATLRRIGTHVIEKIEDYESLPKIILVSLVDGDTMIVHKTVLCEGEPKTITRRYKRLPGNNV